MELKTGGSRQKMAKIIGSKRKFWRDLNWIELFITRKKRLYVSALWDYTKVWKSEPKLW